MAHVRDGELCMRFGCNRTDTVYWFDYGTFCPSHFPSFYTGKTATGYRMSVLALDELWEKEQPSAC